MKKTLMCATAAAALATVGATAQAEDGWYARADAQFSFEGTLDQDGATDVIGTIPGKTSLNETAGASVGLGYGFANGLRLEGVLGNRAGPLDCLAGTPAHGPRAGEPPVAASFRAGAGPHGQRLRH